MKTNFWYKQEKKNTRRIFCYQFNRQSSYLIAKGFIYGYVSTLQIKILAVSNLISEMRVLTQSLNREKCPCYYTRTMALINLFYLTIQDFSGFF